ncbi:hypothetical protein BpHYR1_006629 [Brachionus plicatilis]|uniref:Uncharacterized protein n=1 Tax=Brachionus plicatilis TaxID=10195 RepID=A0A3M7SET9_BRAPC|nr:hypothetical protein BpHYR1_006629 [Brachionus plicatilis]
MLKRLTEKYEIKPIFGYKKNLRIFLGNKNLILFNILNFCKSKFNFVSIVYLSNTLDNSIFCIETVVTMCTLKKFLSISRKSKSSLFTKNKHKFYSNLKSINFLGVTGS